MNKYNLNIVIPAYTREEAEAKLQLMVQMAAFCTDFDLLDLTIAFLRCKTLTYLNESTYKPPEQPKATIKTMRLRIPKPSTEKKTD